MPETDCAWAVSMATEAGVGAVRAEVSGLSVFRVTQFRIHFHGEHAMCVIRKKAHAITQ